VTTVLVDYADALRTADADRLIETVSIDCTFRSPFSTWTRHIDVARACRARTRAFSGWHAVTTTDDGTTAWLRWSAVLAGSDTQIEGVDVLRIDGNTVTHIDVFLRPAGALEQVYRAMSEAWR
jgi:hypothetical protein